MLQGAGLGYRRDLADDFLNLSSNNDDSVYGSCSRKLGKNGGGCSL